MDRLRVNSRKPLAPRLWALVGPDGRRQMEDLRKTLARAEAARRAGPQVQSKEVPVHGR